MSKIRKMKIQFKHLLTALSALGMVFAFIVSLTSKKKGAACALFFASLAGLAAGIGMEAGVLPEPACCKKLEIEPDEEEEDFGSFLNEDDGIFFDEEDDEQAE